MTEHMGLAGVGKHQADQNPQRRGLARAVGPQETTHITLTDGEVQTVNGEDFSGSAQHEGATINAWLKGNADYAAIDALEMLLTRTHAEADRLSIKEARSKGILWVSRTIQARKSVVQAPPVKNLV